MKTQNNPFAGLGEASFARRTSTWVTDGTYTTEIQSVKKRESTHPQRLGEVSVIIDLAIVDVIVDKGEFTTPGGEVKRSNQTGEVVTIFIKMKWGEKALEMLKSFLCAAAKISPQAAAEIASDQWLEFAEKSCFRLGDEVEGFDTDGWAEQPLSGAAIKITACTVLTKSGHDFTRVDFSESND